MSNAEKSAAGSIIWNSTMFGKCLAAERMGEEKEKKRNKIWHSEQEHEICLYETVILLYIMIHISYILYKMYISE